MSTNDPRTSREPPPLPESEPQLKRSLGLLMITVYGLGTIIGGGFYALTGDVVGEAGMLAPLAFLAAAGIALLSAFSFAELSARFPFSAGEAFYVRQAFGKKWLSTTVGWMVIATGVVSAATLANAFSGFVRELVPLPDAAIIVFLVLILGAVTAWGITESAIIAFLVTVVEVGGLLLVLAFSGGHLSEVPQRWQELTPTLSSADWIGIFMGAYLAFYSFVGFEDMVNVAEEVKEPERNLQIAILISVIATGAIYFVVTMATVLAVGQQALIESNSPLSLAVGDWEFGVGLITVIGMLAGLNGALVQMIMASRVAYGLARKNQGPAFLGKVHPRRQTPVHATVAVTAIVLALALWLPLESLAKMTSTILLMVYGLVNLSLWWLKSPKRELPFIEGAPSYPRWLPLVGAVVCAVFLIFNVGANFLWS